MKIKEVHNLIRPDCFDKFINYISGQVSTISSNSSFGSLLIANCLKNRFYDQDIHRMLELISSNLLSTNLKNQLRNSLSEYNFPDKMFDLEKLWFAYYIGRLPTIMYWNCPIHEGRRHRPSEYEIKTTCDRVAIHWLSLAKRNVGESEVDNCIKIVSHSLKHGYRLSKWWVSRTKVDDYSYDSSDVISKIWQALTEILRNDISNSHDLFHVIMSDSFPMFIDSLIADYRKQLFYGANLGFLVGTKNTQELIQSFTNNE